MGNELFGIFLDMHKINLLTEDDLIYKRAAEKILKNPKIILDNVDRI